MPCFLISNKIAMSLAIVCLRSLSMTQIYIFSIESQVNQIININSLFRKAPMSLLDVSSYKATSSQENGLCVLYSRHKYFSIKTQPGIAIVLYFFSSFYCIHAVQFSVNIIWTEKLRKTKQTEELSERGSFSLAGLAGLCCCAVVGGAAFKG